MIQLNKFEKWANSMPDFRCAKCKTDNKKKEGQQLGICEKCNNNTWNRYNKLKDREQKITR